MAPENYLVRSFATAIATRFFLSQSPWCYPAIGKELDLEQVP